MNNPQHHTTQPTNGDANGNGFHTRSVTDTPVVDPSLPTNPAPDQLQDRWRLIQAEFVDDPRKSVSEAHQLVESLLENIVDSFTQQRDVLERQWTSGEQVSTEQLRVSLQHYRTLFSRLLVAAPPSH